VRVLHLLTIKQVAKKYGKSEAQVRYAILQGRLKYVKIGWMCFCPLEELPNDWPMSPRQLKKSQKGDSTT
jgi:hypothetical protein